MCGAFSILYPFKGGWDEAIENNSQTLLPRYNARPGQNLPAVLNTHPNELQIIKWGLKPVWMKGKMLINVRDNSLANKYIFRDDLWHRRCIIPADGFYEWKNIDGTKYPFRFVLKTKSTFSFAGIWEEDPKTKEPLFAIITTEPNKLVAKVHDRMPVILHKKDETKWLNTKEDANLALDLLAPYPAHLMDGYPVSTMVNSSKNDFPEIIKPIKV